MKGQGPTSIIGIIDCQAFLVLTLEKNQPNIQVSKYIRFWQRSLLLFGHFLKILYSFYWKLDDPYFHNNNHKKRKRIFSYYSPSSNQFLGSMFFSVRFFVAARSQYFYNSDYGVLRRIKFFICLKTKLVHTITMAGFDLGSLKSHGKSEVKSSSD